MIATCKVAKDGQHIAGDNGRCRACGASMETGAKRVIVVEVSGRIEDRERVNNCAEMVLSQVRSCSEMMRLVQSANEGRDPSVKPVLIEVHTS